MKLNKKISLLLLFLLSLQLLSQQSEYSNYYLFAIDIQSKNSGIDVANLKMILVDEEEKPYVESVSKSETKTKTQKLDTLFFWKNETLRKGKGTKPLFQQNFYHLGTYFIVVFHLENSKLEDPLKQPIYQLKIENAINEPFGLSLEKQVYHLPLQKAIEICVNEITEDSPLTKPIKSLDGKNFEPILIDLDTQDEIKLAEDTRKDEPKYIVRFEYKEEKGIEEGMDEYLLNYAKIFDSQTGKLHQEIYIPSISKSISKESKNIVKFIDFYERGLNEAKDFSVQIESWRDLKNKVSREKTNFYIFNLQTKKYDLDTTLSNYDDVFYYLPLKKMRRYDYQTTEKSRTVYTYQLENKKWILIDRNETLFQAEPPKIKYSAKNCIIYKENYHFLPLKAIIGNNSKILVKDTFWLYNACDDTVFISKVQSASRDFFSVNQTLLPKQNTPLVFNGILEANSFDFTTSNFNCRLTLNENFTLVFEISVPRVSNNAKVYYRSDSTIQYAIANREKSRFSNAVFTYENGNLRSRGIVQDKDTSLKVGHWMFFKEGSNIYDPEFIHDITYSKSISLSAFDEKQGYLHNRFKIKIFEKGNWKNPITESIDNSVRFFITEKADSILAYTDSTSYAFAINYKKIHSDVSKEIYLLKPKERSLKIGYYEIPFQLIKDQYTIVLNYSCMRSRSTLSHKLVDSCFAELQKTYPGILPVWVSKHQRGVNLESLSDEEKKKVLLQLTNDSCIAFVCQLFTVVNQTRLGFCDNRVYADIDIEDEEDFKRKARKIGFVDVSIDSGNNRFWLTHESKLIDDRFFEDFKKLTKHPLVKGAFLNTHAEAELDNGLKH